jgi:hypothetical protein
MTPALSLTMTTAGLGRFTAAQASDDIDLTIAKVGLTASVFVTSPTLDALPGEFRRLGTISGTAIGDNLVHMIVRDEEALAYEVRGFGLFLADGTLFAIYGQPDPIAGKSVASTLLFAFDIAFPTTDIAQLTFGDTNFLNPPATSETRGVVALATDQEVADGTNDRKAITPKRLAARLASLIPLFATTAETDAGTATNKAVTPASLVNIIAGIADRVRMSRRINTSGLALGGGALNTDITVSVPAATAAQLLNGTASNVAVTPEALAQAGVVYLVERKSAGASWYRRYSDGFVEMSGIGVMPANEVTFTLMFPWPFPTSCDGIWSTIINSGQTNDGESTVQEVALAADQATLFAQNHKSPTVDAGGGFRWFARGH